MPFETLVEEMKFVQMLQPATDATGRTSFYVSMKSANLFTVTISIAQGNAAPVPITIEQATNVAGAGSKVITVAVPIWANLDTAASDTLVRRTSAIGYTTDVGVKNKVVVFQIDPADLDIANGFDCICIKTAASNVANVDAANGWIQARFAQATPLSAIID